MALKKKFSLSEMQNTADPAFRYRMMQGVVERVHEPREFFMPVLNLVATFIDGLASGLSGASKPAYLKYLATNFPELCKALGAEIFYSKYRNAAVHEFGIKPGFAIGQGGEFDGAYVG